MLEARASKVGSHRTKNYLYFAFISELNSLIQTLAKQRLAEQQANTMQVHRLALGYKESGNVSPR